MKKYVIGHICFEHFSPEDFVVHNKKSGKTVLKKGALPRIEHIQEKEHVHQDDSTDSTTDRSYCCRKSIAEKDAIIKSIEREHALKQNHYEKQIMVLQDKVNELQLNIKHERDRNYYLETTKKKLKAALEQIETDKIDASKIELLKVRILEGMINCGSYSIEPIFIFDHIVSF